MGMFWGGGGGHGQGFADIHPSARVVLSWGNGVTGEGGSWSGWVVEVIGGPVRGWVLGKVRHLGWLIDASPRKQAGEAIFQPGVLAASGGGRLAGWIFGGL